VTKLSINFEEILSRAHRNFEEQKRIFESSINYELLHYYYSLHTIIILYKP